MSNEAALALANCLTALESGELSLDEYLERQPDQRAVLTELVPLAQQLRTAPAVTPSLDFRADARRRLIAHLPERRARRRIEWPAFSSRVWLRGLVALIIVVVLSSSVLVASAQALPNDPLYPLKLAVEQLQLTLSPDQLARSELNLNFAGERLAEVQRLIDRGRAMDAAPALTGFADQMEFAVTLATDLPDSTERQALLSRLYSSLDRSAVILQATERQLPQTAQPALDRARAVLRHPPVETPPAELPTPTATFAPTFIATLKPTRVQPTIMSTPDRPAITPTPNSHSVPTLRPTFNPTVLSTRPPTPAAPNFPTLIPTRWQTYVPTQWAPTPWPTLLPTNWPTLIATLRPTRWPTFPPPPPSGTRPPIATPNTWPTSWPTPNPTWGPGPIHTPAPAWTPFRPR